MTKTNKPLLTFLMIIFFIINFSTLYFCKKGIWTNAYANVLIEEKLPGVIPKAKNIKPAIAGFDNFVADLYWLKSIQFVSSSGNWGELSSLRPMLELITDLDPKFEFAYHFGFLILPLTGETEGMRNILYKGIKENPKSWKIYMDLGNTEYYYFDNYDQAIEVFKKCAEIKGCPKGVRNIIGNLQLKRGKYEIAIRQWTEISATTNNFGTKKVAQQKIEEAEKLNNLNVLAKIYQDNLEKKLGQIKNIDDLKNNFDNLIKIYEDNLEKKRGQIKNIDALKKAFLKYKKKEMFTSPFGDRNPFIWNVERGKITTTNW